MIHTLNINSKFLLYIINMNLDNKNYILKNTSFYDTQSRMKNNDIFDEDKEVYQLLVEYKIETKNRIEDVILLGFLNEQTGLEVLKNMKYWDIERINEYVPYESHINYINSLSEDDKNGLKHSFWNKYINIDFVPTTKKELRKILMLDEYPYISFGDTYACAKTIFKKTTTMGKYYTGTTKGYIFKNVETAEKIINKIADIEYEIELQKEKLKFNTESINDKYRYFNIPIVNAIHDEEEIEFDVKAAWDNDMCSFTTKLVIDIELIGNIEEIIYCESKSLYTSSVSATDERKKVARNMNIPLNDYDVPFVFYDKIMEEYKKQSLEHKNNITEKVNQVLLENNLEGKIFIDDNNNVIVNILIKYDDGFEYTASSRQKYFTSLDDTISWIKSYNQNYIEETYDFENKRSIFLAKNLPKV